LVDEVRVEKVDGGFVVIENLVDDEILVEDNESLVDDEEVFVELVLNKLDETLVVTAIVAVLLEEADTALVEETFTDTDDDTTTALPCPEPPDPKFEHPACPTQL
jgi:hypothetical protein